jgi:hypothetical protein
MYEVIEIFMEKLQEMIKQDVQDEVKQYKDTSIKELEKDTETPK